ncbi:hypothetical protein F5X71_17520 [Nocardia brasiliensis]|uniref:Histidine phosphatase family protein n=2 Tax=Nocardia brasiliensis TaxID=37326 RepID=A0A6G9XSF1_NOCBR|nr:histidine phosphatase family protein [Nocardia brasiliensis]QIS03882.1 hypothetical protein F5X71_17520 [Nocardia brasiliensis]
MPVADAPGTERRSRPAILGTSGPGNPRSSTGRALTGAAYEPALLRRSLRSGARAPDRCPNWTRSGSAPTRRSTDPAARRRTAEVLRDWIVARELARRVSDGESGFEVVARMSSAFTSIADAHPRETIVVVGHVAALSVTVSRLCGLGSSVWGRPLDHAAPFLLTWDGADWRCAAWPVPPVAR